MRFVRSIGLAAALVAITSVSEAQTTQSMAGVAPNPQALSKVLPQPQAPSKAMPLVPGKAVPSGQMELFGDRTYLNIGNHTGRDLWIQMTGDVHTGNWGPAQINNNQVTGEQKSKKIDFGNNATFHVRVWKNNNGQQGEFVGEFDSPVRYNAAGNRDHVELTTINVNGQLNMQAWSTRQLAALAIIIWTGG